MSFSVSAPHVQPRRRELNEQLEHVDLLNDDDFDELYKQHHEEVDSFTAFRHGAPSTQRTQDHDKKAYLLFVKNFYFRGQDVSDIELELDAFPHDEKKLINRMKNFISYVVKNTPGKRLNQEHVGMSRLLQYRKSMTFWCRRVYYQRRDADPHYNVPNFTLLFNKITEVMRAQRSAMGLVGIRNPKKTYLGNNEFVQLIMFDLGCCINIANAEQHHLVWAISRLLALRPGSLGAPRETLRVHDAASGPDHLVWGDLVLQRLPTTGMFEILITIRSLKTGSRTDAVRAHGNMSVQLPPLRIRSPTKSDNMIFSVPHRVLTIGLRRGAFANVRTVSELMSGTEAYIAIKEEFRDKPVFLGSGPRGLIVTDKPMLAASMGNYLGDKGERLGFPYRPSTYSFRRGNLTEMRKIFDTETAQRLAGHQPNTNTLMRFYIDVHHDIDVTGALLPGETQRNDDLHASTMAMSKLSPADASLLYGAALNSLVDEMVARDPNFPHQIANLKLYKRRVRRQALQTLTTAFHSASREKLTLEELQRRREEILGNAAAFTRTVAENASKTFQHDIEDETDGDEDLNLDDSFPDTGPGAHADEAAAEDDPEGGLFVQDSDASIDDVRVEDAELEGEDLNNVDGDIMTQGEAFINYYLGYELPQPGPNMLVCDECMNDSTLPDSERYREWKKGKLEEHQRSDTHTGNAKFIRQMKIDIADKGFCSCPFCDVIRPSDVGQHQLQRGDRVKSHILASTRKQIQGMGSWKKDEDLIEAHDRLKRQAGWYEPSFFQSDKTWRLKEKKRRRTSTA